MCLVSSPSKAYTQTAVIVDVKKPCYMYWATSESFVGLFYIKRFPVWKQTNTFAEASKTALAEGRKWKKYACRIFLCHMFKVFVLFTFALTDFCRLVWWTRKSRSIKWLEFLTHLWPTWPTTYWTTRPFTIVHLTFEFFEAERSHNIEKVITERRI